MIQGHFPFFALDHEFLALDHEKLALDHEFLPNSLLAMGGFGLGPGLGSRIIGPGRAYDREVQVSTNSRQNGT